MADEQDFKIKGAASASAEEGTGKEANEQSPEEAHEESASPGDNTSEDGEIAAGHSEPEVEEKKYNKEQTKEDQLKHYRWCKCLCDPAQFGRDHYFLQMDTNVSQWEEPSEPYWLWDATRQAIDESGLHYPQSASKPGPPSEKDPSYTGYNPKIHGHYDPNADYAQYHDKKREQEAVAFQAPQGMYAPAPGTDYAAAGTFNRFTGNFQDADKNSDRHNDYNKSGRQMGAYFDVDAAANAHDGKSLKEERRNEKLSKKQIKELAEKRRAKKEKKRMDFYKS